MIAEGEASARARAGGARRPLVGVDFHTFEGLYQGSRSRLLGLYRELLAAPELDFVLFTREPERLRAALPAFDPARVRFHALASRRAPSRIVLELPRLARALGVDLFDAQYVLPRGLACKTVVTVHDVLFESHPECFARSFVLRSRVLVRRSARAADHVVTVSAWSAEEIRRRYRIPEERVTVSPDAVDLERFRPGSADEGALARRGLARGGYLLAVGRVDRRKNLAVLVEAHAGIAGAPPLVVVGQAADARAAAQLAAACARPGARVRHLSDVADDELPGLYAGATAFAFPSLAEGFGMPVLEAMACGVPVACSDRTALAEVAGGAAELFDPTRVGAVRDALARVLSVTALRERLVGLGLERARATSWKREAERVRALYGRLLSVERPR